MGKGVDNIAFRSQRLFNKTQCQVVLVRVCPEASEPDRLLSLLQKEMVS